MTDKMQFAGNTGQQPQGGDDPVVEQANNAQDERPLRRADIESIVNEVSAKQFQAWQSMLGKQEARLKSEIERTVGLLNKSGVALTPDQMSKVRDNIVEELKSVDVSDKPQAAQPGNREHNPSQPPQMDPISQAAYELMKSENVFIDQSDPEFQNVKTNGTPREFLSSIQEAIDSKKERLTRPRGAPSASPSLAATGGNVNAGSLEAQYQKELSLIKRGDNNGLLALKRRYREKGLPV